MKKLCLPLLIVLLTSLLACQKQDDVSTTGSTQSIEVPTSTVPPPDKNYCKGCGTSSSENFHCAGRSCEENGPCERTDAMAFVSNPTAGQIQETEAMYDVRDEFLINFELGQWYITYYYTLSQLSAENNLITQDNYQEYLDFGTDLLVVTDEIRFGMPSSVPINTSLNARAMVFINRFRAVTADELILGYLDNIESDLNKFTGKDVSFIRTEIGL